MFSTLRALVFLRRIARSTERIAVSLESLVELRTREWESANVRPRPRKELTRFDTLDMKATNKRWHEERAARGLEESDV